MSLATAVATALLTRVAQSDVYGPAIIDVCRAVTGG